MCPGRRRSSPPPTGTVSDARSPSLEAASLLLELSASDDLSTFKRAVEDAGLPIDAAAPWYCRSSAGAMAYQQRTPLMIAALYGSISVMGYILSARPAEAARRAASDGATALHCAAAGGSEASLEAAKLLIAAFPDVIDAVDASGNRPGDIVARQFSNTAFKSLEVILRSPTCPRVSSPSKEEVVAKVGEKKEYPQSPDLMLPDINTGIYVTDEFRMYAFKIKPCSRAYSHDWTECPFAHPGENARRRDPRKHSYSCVPCPEFRKGSCHNGDACEYAHGVFESWLHPAQYRTRLCKDETGCNRRVCFFAHKVVELRTVNPSAASMTGTAAFPSPKSSAHPGVSSIDMATALLLMQQSGSPASSQTGSVATSPALPLPSNRLKTSKSARNMEVDLEVLGLEGYQKKLIDDVRRTNSLVAAAAAAGAPDYNHLLGSVDPSLLNKLQGLSVRSMQPSQLLSSYGSSSSASPIATASSSFGLDHSMAKAIMNSRASAFAKRSLSFCDRGAPAGRQSTLSAMTTATIAPQAVSDWRSPDGKLDWSVQGEELSKLKKSATFAFRNNQAVHGGVSSTPGSNEPDVSWVTSLVKDGPPVAPVSRISAGKQQNGYPLKDGGKNSHNSEFFYPWVEDKIMA
ncbi:zinc finger CCCH domain-containing protein 33-like [Curcuma longa]|uniref:zinc finger CCCH domain-containing protein 33-like n=1 Tax=Curcuma longa TaxID=136217 RepID=UPI003D9EDB35